MKFVLVRPLVGMVGGLLLLALDGSAATVTIRPIADTSLFESAPNNNLGRMAFMPVGTIKASASIQNRGLMLFDITNNIPAGSTIQSVTLRVNVTISGSATTVPFDLHRMLVSWTEGDNTGGPFSGSVGSAAGTGESSWNRRAAPSTTWGAPGCLAGTDFQAQASGSQPIAPTSASTFTNSGLAVDVQGWLNNPSSNLGWLMKVQNENVASTARRISSREDVNNAPQLTITFQPVPMIETWGVTGNQFHFEFPALAGTPYEVRRTSQLFPELWMTFTNILPQAAGTVVIFDDVATGPQFYQVLIPGPD